MLVLTPHERRAAIFVGAAFFFGLCLDLSFKVYPPAYASLTLLDKAPARAKVDINRATYAQLLDVPGIGPSSAARIINARQKNGPFASLDGLRDIKKLSRRTLEKAIPSLTVGAP